MERKRICIGIPCFVYVSPETLEDYMRFAFYLGRHYPEHDFLLYIKPKTEQFRARNAMVEGALQGGADYLLMLDDDHVLDWRELPQHEPNAEQKPYEFLRTLLGHMEREEKAAIVGALYYTRGGDCKPVVMKEGKDGGYYWMRDDEIEHGLQEVAVTGGGCMLIDMNLFSRISPPWFEPEFDLGTDLQICRKAREEGFRVFCDTSVVIGHVLSRREIVSPKNRHRIIAESAEVAKVEEGMDRDWGGQSAMALYQADASEYLGIGLNDIAALAGEYSMDDMSEHETLEDYYRSKGKEQLARQVCFHAQLDMMDEMKSVLSLINTGVDGYGVDYGCGSAPIGFELALRGHKMDFIDIDGAGAYEFTKWRVKHRGIEDRVGWSLKGPYDYVLMMDSIEHLKDWQSVLGEVIDVLKPDGMLITNYFRTFDFQNAEHISMDHAAVKDFLTDHGIYPLNDMAWIKRDLDFMTKESAA